MNPFRTFTPPPVEPPRKIGELQRMSKWIEGRFMIEWTEGCRMIEVTITDESHRQHSFRCDVETARAISSTLNMAACEAATPKESTPR